MKPAPPVTNDLGILQPLSLEKDTIPQSLRDDVFHATALLEEDKPFNSVQTLDQGQSPFRAKDKDTRGQNIGIHGPLGQNRHADSRSTRPSCLRIEDVVVALTVLHKEALIIAGRSYTPGIDFNNRHYFLRIPRMLHTNAPGFVSGF